MNKIKVANNSLEQVNVGKNIEVEYYEQNILFGINEIKLNVVKNCTLELEIDLDENSKLSFDIKVNENINFDLSIISKGTGGKVQYKYLIKENGTCNVLKFQNVFGIKEMIIASLMGKHAKFNYNFKTISISKETYDYNVFHEAENTESNIKNNGVCIKDGSIIYQVSAFVPKEIKGCNVNQSNRIINLTDNVCEIMPNLYIDCNDVVANHSALIGKFEDNELFYLMSRGIDYDNAVKLLISGFLKSNINNEKIIKEINNNLDKYWG